MSGRDPKSTKAEKRTFAYASARSPNDRPRQTDLGPLVQSFGAIATSIPALNSTQLQRWLAESPSEEGKGTYSKRSSRPCPVYATLSAKYHKNNAAEDISGTVGRNLHLMFTHHLVVAWPDPLYLVDSSRQ